MDGSIIFVSGLDRASKRENNYQFLFSAAKSEKEMAYLGMLEHVVGWMIDIIIAYALIS